MIAAACPTLPYYLIGKMVASMLSGIRDGVIRIGGADVKHLSLENQNAKIAYVSQDSYLFNLSVMENIRLGRGGGGGSEKERELMAAIDALTMEKTILIIAHRLKTVQKPARSSW